MGILQSHSNQSDLVLRIDEQIGETRQRDIVSALEEMPGVAKADFTENRPHLIHVSFNPRETSYIEIIARLYSLDIQARRVE